jgi:DNA-binding HxlR family transcriptional regulator
MVTMNKPLPKAACSTDDLESALKILEGRWKTLIIFHLFGAPVRRFSELQRAIPGISQKMLIQQLRDLEGHGIVSRKVFPEVPPKVEYGLSSDGLALRPALVALQTWAGSRGAAAPRLPGRISSKASHRARST